LIRTVPGLEGHLWVPLSGNGLKYSTNHGATYTTLANVPYCTAVGIGKAMAGASYPTLFIWGTVSGVTGLFRSTDQGATWGARMNDDAHEFGGASMLIGDMNVEGRVYMASNGGRGLIYWDIGTAVVTRINQLSDNSIQVYPNPFVSEFNVTKSEGSLQVSVFDVLGRKVETAKSSSSKLSMGSSLKSGVYIVKIEGVNTNDSKSFRIIKK